MSRFFVVLIMTIVMISGAIGCSSNSNPVTPKHSDNIVSDDTPLVASETDFSSMSGVFGIYEVEINPENLSAEIHSLRTADVLGDGYHVNITPYLKSYPCPDCVNISSISINGDFLDIDFQTRHPFDPFTRFDLHVFDMRGIIVIGDNTKTFNRIGVDLDGDGIRESLAEGNFSFLCNPDGYTSFYDMVLEDLTGREFNGNLCPFRNLWVQPFTKLPDSNYAPDIAPQHGFTDLVYPTGHNVFPMGGKFDSPYATTHFRFDFSELDTTTFIYVLEASYGHTTTRYNRLEPRYFLPEFHRKDAWRVMTDIFDNDLNEAEPDSTAKLSIAVMDWQAGISPNPEWDYISSDLRDIKNASDVKIIEIDIPEIFQLRKSVTLADKKRGDGSFESPYVWEIEFSNEKSASSGYYTGIVAVRDQLEGTPNAPYGIPNSTSEPIRLGDISTYQTFIVYIEQDNIPPVAIIVDNDADNIVDSGDLVIFQPGDGTIDPDGEIIKYEYDFNYDGTNFHANITQHTGNADFGNPVSYQFVNSSGSDVDITVAMRVTDNGEPGLTDIDTTVITVRPASGGFYIFEDFETTTASELPVGWGVTGRYGGAYFLNTLGEGCANTTWKWGVTSNASQCENGETNFLNESGFENPYDDLDYVYQNRATIVYTPEFEIPPTGATLTVRHWFDFTYEEVFTSIINRDAGQPILSIQNPGIVEWEDFCYAMTENNHPKRSLSIIGGPVGYDFLMGYASGNNPFRGWSCHTGSSGGWITSMYDLPSIWAGQSVRVGFLFVSDDLRIDIANDCSPLGISPSIFTKPGWRINWIRIEAN